MRHFYGWEIADIGLLLFAKKAGAVVSKKVALLQSKRLYPSGNRGHHGRLGHVGGSGLGTLVSQPSGIIDTLAEAEAYCRKHLGGKSFDLTVRRPSGLYKICMQR